jgi:hypothetical protein
MEKKIGPKAIIRAGRKSRALVRALIGEDNALI